jgi:hypothetical protein
MTTGEWRMKTWILSVSPVKGSKPGKALNHSLERVRRGGRGTHEVGRALLLEGAT